MLHRVNNNTHSGFSPNSHLSITPRFLERMIVSMKSAGYEFVSMDEVHDRIKNPSGQSGKKPFLAMTLDDGYRDNLEFAVPVFQRHNIPYMIYIAPGLVDGTASLWWEDIEQMFAKHSHLYADMPEGHEDFDLSSVEKKNSIYASLTREMLFELSEEEQRGITAEMCKAYYFDQEAYTRDQIMDWANLAGLLKDPLCSIGAHTMGHHALAKMTDKQMRYEISQSKHVLKSELGIDARHFAYPYGHAELAGKREFDFAAEFGFKTAVTTRHGVVHEEHINHMTALPRVSVNGKFQAVGHIKALACGIPTLLMNKGRKLNVA